MDAISKEAPVPASGDAAHAILSEAADIVRGARQQTHGDKERSFQAIADLWNAYLNARKGGGRLPVTALDVSMMMVAMKMARAVQGTAVRDHFVDMAGYAGIAGELVGGLVPVPVEVPVLSLFEQASREREKELRALGFVSRAEYELPAREVEVHGLHWSTPRRMLRPEVLLHYGNMAGEQLFWREVSAA